jgi:hypothetical protein
MLLGMLVFDIEHRWSERKVRGQMHYTRLIDFPIVITQV